MEHVHTTFLPAQDDVSHPDSERELVLRVGFGIERENLATSWFAPLTGICGSPLRGGWPTESEWFFIPDHTVDTITDTGRWSPVIALAGRRRKCSCVLS